MIIDHDGQEFCYYILQFGQSTHRPKISDGIQHEPGLSLQAIILSTLNPKQQIGVETFSTRSSKPLGTHLSFSLSSTSFRGLHRPLRRQGSQSSANRVPIFGARERDFRSGSICPSRYEDFSPVLIIICCYSKIVWLLFMKMLFRALLFVFFRSCFDFTLSLSLFLFFLVVSCNSSYLSSYNLRFSVTLFFPFLVTTLRSFLYRQSRR